jgi:hypothetical protein
MKGILTSTPDMNGGFVDARDGMLRSMAESSVGLGANGMLLAILFQNCDPDDFPSLTAILPSVVRPVVTPPAVDHAQHRAEAVGGRRCHSC